MITNKIHFICRDHPVCLQVVFYMFWPPEAIIKELTVITKRSVKRYSAAHTNKPLMCVCIYLVKGPTG